MMTAVISPPVGCYVEGSWGQYASARMIEIASEMGFEVKGEDALTLDVESKAAQHGRTDDERENQLDLVLDLADRAEAWLNDHAPEGFLWGWRDGEFYFQSLSWWQAE